jgi:hypothetical protein
MGFYSESRGEQCHDVPCYVGAFDVVVSDEGSDVFRLTVDDDCNMITNLKLLSGIVRSAFDLVVEADGLTPETCGCCRDGAELSFNLAGKYAEFTTTATVTEDTYTVSPPFKSGS